MTTLSPSKPVTAPRRFLTARLIFNPSAGRPEESATQLAALLETFQALNFRAEVYMLRPDSRPEAVVRNAIRRGIRLIVVSGGDGTVESILGAVVGTPATLGIIPTGTRNNVARSLGIPLDDVAEAVALLRYGRRVKIDVGHARSPQRSRHFLEFAGAGLAPALYPAADEIQKGNLRRIGDFLSTLVSYPPAEMRLALDDQDDEVVATNAHMLVAANMPYMGYNFRVAEDVAPDDGWLDVLVFSNFTKLDLLGMAVQLATGTPPEDPRIQRFRARRLAVRCAPEMPLMADGFVIGEGALSVTLAPAALNVMAGPDALLSSARAGESPVEAEQDAAEE